MMPATAGPISRATDTSAVDGLPSEKWSGASKCVPPCSGVQIVFDAYHQPPGVLPNESTCFTNADFAFGQ